ncbi:hypothetical protein HKD37_10G028812 [Glycine soja]
MEVPHNAQEFIVTPMRFDARAQNSNDLVYVMYNLKLKSKQNRKTIVIPFDEIESDSEWITKEGYNDEDEQPQGEGDGGNVELVGDAGGSSNDLVVDTFDLDNLILVEPNDAQFEEDLDDDGDGDESDDIHGDDPIIGLYMVTEDQGDYTDMTLKDEEEYHELLRDLESSFEKED